MGFGQWVGGCQWVGGGLGRCRWEWYRLPRALERIIREADVGHTVQLSCTEELIGVGYIGMLAVCATDNQRHRDRRGAYSVFRGQWPFGGEEGVLYIYIERERVRETYTTGEEGCSLFN